MPVGILNGLNHSKVVSAPRNNGNTTNSNPGNCPDRTRNNSVVPHNNFTNNRRRGVGFFIVLNSQSRGNFRLTGNRLFPLTDSSGNINKIKTGLTINNGIRGQMITHHRHLLGLPLTGNFVRMGLTTKRNHRRNLRFPERHQRKHGRGPLRHSHLTTTRRRHLKHYRTLNNKNYRNRDQNYYSHVLFSRGLLTVMRHHRKGTTRGPVISGRRNIGLNHFRNKF